VEPEGSLPHLQELATRPNPEPEQPSHPIFLRPIFPSKQRSSNLSLSLQFPHQNLYTFLFSPIRIKCPAHLILRDFITQIVFGT